MKIICILFVSVSCLLGVEPKGANCKQLTPLRTSPAIDEQTTLSVTSHRKGTMKVNKNTSKQAASSVKKSSKKK